jgi:drug/metabolite transporter (DMT)-like permease
MAQLIASIRTSKTETWKVVFALLSLYFIWGSTYLAVNLALATFTPMALVASRFWLAGTILLLIAFSRGEHLPHPRLIRNAALIGCLTLGMGSGAVVLAMQWVSAGLTALAVAAVPLWIGIFAALMFKRPSKSEWFGTIIGFTGIILLNMEHSFQAAPLGAIILIIGPMSWSFGSILSRRLELPTGWMALMIETLAAASFATILSLLTGEHPDTVPTMQSFSALLYLSLVGTVIGFTAYMYLLKTVRPSLATSYAYINPLVAIILSIIFLGETISPIAMLAMLTILTGVVIVVLARAKE